MSKNNILPISKIGSENWAHQLKKFLQKYEIDTAGISLKEETKLITFGLSDEIRLYYKNFGATDSAEFMYYLRKAHEIEWLQQSRYGKTLAAHFPADELDKFVVLSDTLQQEPICVHIEDQGIYIFTIKPTIVRAKLFHSFNDMLLLELINFKKQVCEFDFDSREEENDFVANLLNEDGLTKEHRHKLYP